MIISCPAVSFTGGLPAAVPHFVPMSFGRHRCDRRVFRKNAGSQTLREHKKLDLIEKLDKRRTKGHCEAVRPPFVAYPISTGHASDEDITRRRAGWKPPRRSPWKPHTGLCRYSRGLESLAGTAGDSTESKYSSSSRWCLVHPICDYNRMNLSRAISQSSFFPVKGEIASPKCGSQ